MYECEMTLGVFLVVETEMLNLREQSGAVKSVGVQVGEGLHTIHW